MLTIEELDKLDKFDLFAKQCLSDCLRLGKLYAYFGTGRKTGTVYQVCDYHLAQDRQKYPHLEIIELSIKEIFYLKC